MGPVASLSENGGGVGHASVRWVYGIHAVTSLLERRADAIASAVVLAGCRCAYAEVAGNE